MLMIARPTSSTQWVVSGKCRNIIKKRNSFKHSRRLLLSAAAPIASSKRAIIPSIDWIINTPPFFLTHYTRRSLFFISQRLSPLPRGGSYLEPRGNKKFLEFVMQYNFNGQKRKWDAVAIAGMSCSLQRIVFRGRYELRTLTLAGWHGIAALFVLYRYVRIGCCKVQHISHYTGNHWGRLPKQRERNSWQRKRSKSPRNFYSAAVF